jgi:hypothetical protein
MRLIDFHGKRNHMYHHHSSRSQLPAARKKTVRPKPISFRRSRTQQMIFCIPLIRVKFIARYWKNILSYFSSSSLSECCKLSSHVDRMNYELRDVASWISAAQSITRYTPICTSRYMPRVL